MKIGIHTWGSEGDIRPSLVLAEALVQAGHEVRLGYCASDRRDYSARLAGAQYEHRHFALPPQSEEEARRVGDEIFAEAHPLRQISRVIQETLEPVIDEMIESACELAKWADVLVSHIFTHPLAAAAEAQHKPFVSLYLAPGFVTREFPPPAMPHLGALNGMAWKLALRLFSGMQMGTVNRVRRRLGLAPLGRAQRQYDRSAIDLVAMSPTLLPRPDDWPEKVHVSGSLIPAPKPRQEPLSAELTAFLTEGPPPIYVTFGSMSTVGDQHGVIEMVERALEDVGCRAIVQSEVPGRSSAKVLRVGPMAHDQVFPRCSAIVHHGGVGTTQAALRSGRPSVVVAHIADQFMWGRQLHKLGVSPQYLTRRKLEPKQLAKAIAKATQDTAMRATAERLGAQMRREDGVGRAVELISLQGAR